MAHTSHVEGREVDTVAGREANTLADGAFHVLAWVLVVTASLPTLRGWRAGRLAPSWSYHLGLVLVGWGVSTSSRAPSITTFSGCTTCATVSAAR